MRRFGLIALFSLSLAGAAFAQDVASLGNGVSVPSYSPVMNNCKQVADNPEMADPENGICVNATRSYLTLLRGLPDDVVTQTLADLVIELSQLPRTEVQCRLFADEIAAAIQIASQQTPDAQQALQLKEISDTLRSQCGLGRTATIDPGNQGSAN